MNLGQTLRWGQMVSYHLSPRNSASRKGVSAKRMKAKFGWVKGFRKDLEAWNRHQQFIQTSLKFINTRVIFVGTAAELEKLLAAHAPLKGLPCELSKSLREKMVEFVKASEAELEPRERAWQPTENLESAFGLFKKLEGQHSKGGFTSLLVAMPSLLKEWTPKFVRHHFANTSIKQIKLWL